ncbi:MAG: MBL fold metallo-hydrolase [Acidobacteria bacterium]|nr:MBL fold metallo-hydrolase [Acidobacteriota bacterium]
MKPIVLALGMLAAALMLPAAEKTMDVYFIDVEGGQATLLVTPEKQSLLIDTGWPGFGDRDADRIVKAAKKAGLKKIDFLLITHYHRDHVGGITQLLSKMSVGTFVDHGPNRETGAAADQLMESYTKAASSGQRLIVKPGDRVPLKGADVLVITSDGNIIDKPVPGGGQANPLCASAQKKADDPTENARSLGVLVSFGSFKFIDIGDLTWNKELELACPSNKVGPVDLYVTTHHGMDVSGPEALVHAIHPRVAIMNNGSRKGGSPAAWKIVKSSPGLEDLWQLHFANAGGQDNNVANAFLADLNETGEGNYIKVSAAKTGAMTVFNSRNRHTKTYAAK